MNPMLLMAGVQLGAPLIGDLLTGGAPDLPDYEGPVRDEYERQRAKIRQALEHRRQRMARELQAKGAGPSAQAALLGPLYDDGREQLIDLTARESAAMADARNRRKTAKYKQESAEYGNRMQGFTDAGNAIVNYMVMQQLYGQKGAGSGDGGKGATAEAFDLNNKLYGRGTAPAPGFQMPVAGPRAPMPGGGSFPVAPQHTMQDYLRFNAGIPTDDFLLSPFKQ